MTDFEQLKEICREACHERGACVAGFDALMHADSIGAILAVWRQNWEDIFGSKFADVMAANVVKVYATARKEFNSADFYVNEDSERGMVIITAAPQMIRLGGTAKGYVFAQSKVLATDNAQVYCRTDGSSITLYGHASANITGHSTVHAYEFSSVRCKGATCHSYQAAQVTATDGAVISYSHRRITAYGSAKVYANGHRGIELTPPAQLLPLTDIK